MPIATPPAAQNKVRPPQRPAQRAVNWRPRRSIQEIEETGRYYVEPEKIPDGMDYEWKAVTCVGLELREHQVRLARDGAWDPVPSSRHPEIVGKFLNKENPDEAIVIGGMMLMERPKQYTDESRAENYRSARARVENHFESLGIGSVAGAPPAKPTVKRDYSTVQLVPDDDKAEA